MTMPTTCRRASCAPSATSMRANRARPAGTGRRVARGCRGRALVPFPARTMPRAIQYEGQLPARSLASIRQTSPETKLRDRGVRGDSRGSWQGAGRRQRAAPPARNAGRGSGLHRAPWKADRVVAEANQGGDMVESVLRAADCQMPIRLVHASRGKSARAEPVAAL